MKVTITDHETAHAALIADSQMELLLDEIVKHPSTLVPFAGAAVRGYETVDQVEGRAKPRPSLEAYGNHFVNSRAEKQAASKIARTLADLFRRYEPGAVRGILIEQIVRRRLRSRYGGINDNLDDNAMFEISDGGWTFDSGKSSIDVLAWDASGGEMHDCKAQAKYFDKAWIERLDSELCGRGWSVALVCADRSDSAARALKARGCSVPRAAVLGPDRWWNRLPLRP